MTEQDQDRESTDASSPARRLRAEVVRPESSQRYLAWVGIVIAGAFVMTLLPWTDLQFKTAVSTIATRGPTLPVGRGEVLVREENLLGIAVDAHRIYYFSPPGLGRENGEIKVASIDGAEQRGELLLSGRTYDVAASDQAFCIFNNDAMSCHDGDVSERFDPTLSSFETHGIPREVVVYADTVYWLTAGADDGALWMRQPQGKPRQLAHGLPLPDQLALAGGTAYFTTCGSNTYPDCVIHSFDIESGSHRVYDSSRGRIDDLAADSDGMVYSLNSDGGTIRGMNDASGESRTLVSGLDNPRAIALDKDRVYWVDYMAGIVAGASRVSGEVTLLAAGLWGPVAGASGGGPLEVALDATHVYWSSVDGTIRRTAKP